MNRASGPRVFLPMKRETRDYAGWHMRASIAVAFLWSGFGKFESTPHSEWVQVFPRIGLGQWFRYFTGSMEIAGGLLYLPRRTCAIGSVLLSSTMIGATVALCTVLRSPTASIVPFTLFVAVVLIALRIPEADSLQNRWRVQPLTVRHR